VLATISMVVLMGFAALAVDVGQFWTVRRSMQTAADAGAVAGAIALRLKQNTNAAAQSATSLNGFTNDSQGVTVTVNNPPAGGAYAGNSEYVEVIVAQPRPTYFMRVLGYSTVHVNARAVASSVNSPACVFALDPTASGALSVGGSSSMNLQCGAMVDSSSSSALSTNGGGALTATSIGVAGGYSGSGYSPMPVTGIAPAPDPLSYLQPPTVGSCNYTKYHDSTAKGTVYLNPGVYCDGIQIDGGATYVFNPGMYILAGGGFKVNSSATLSGTGVTFYNTYTSKYPYDGISFSGSTTVNFSAPTSGPYEAILFYQDPTVPTGSAGSTITGSSTSTFDGALYFPTTPLSYSGNSSSSGYTIIVGDTVSVSGNSYVGDNYTSLTDGSPIRSTALYE
jgi:Flp pilus assembly protein TadG